MIGEKTMLNNKSNIKGLQIGLASPEQIRS
jgi:hypothetical protein